MLVDVHCVLVVVGKLWLYDFVCMLVVGNTCNTCRISLDIQVPWRPDFRARTRTRPGDIYVSSWYVHRHSVKQVEVDTLQDFFVGCWFNLNTLFGNRSYRKLPCFFLTKWEQALNSLATDECWICLRILGMLSLQIASARWCQPVAGL